jgi:Bacteriocin-protection, YdeI or OmpD-Associated
MRIESRLKRKLNSMPADVRQALEARGLVAAYAARPAYQRNDYLGWIGRAVREETRRKRLEQMLDELAHGDLYMKMPHKPKAIHNPKARALRSTKRETKATKTAGVRK